METQSVERRLAAVFAADMAGYSRMMEADEAGTLARFKNFRQSLVDPTISKHRGRIIKTTGDGMLVEFQSVIDAVQCAVAIQRQAGPFNADTPADRRIQFRIGINVGDIIVEPDDIFGDGVNVAARLQEMSEPGGICISLAVRDQVGDRIDIDYVDLGQCAVKNISRPIHTFRIALEKGKPATGGGTKATVTPDAQAAKPSIAVLPFANMSGDPEQEFFTDGLTEDIITELSRFRDLFVISRNSTYRYKGKAVHVREVARELGVQYVVEGSVRKSGNRVRVTTQLIDAETDRHIWAERYDRSLEDIFAIQDEVTSAIVATLSGRIEASSHDRAKRKITENMAAYEYVLAGKVLHHRSTRADNEEALRLLDRAIELDPNYAHAHAWRGCILGQRWVYGWLDDRKALEDEVMISLNKALTLDDNDSDVHRILAAVNLVQHNFDKAIYHQERALSLNPNNDIIVVQQGEILTWFGQPDEGIDWIKKAMRLNPFFPERFWGHLGRAYYMARRYSDAIDAFGRITRPDHTHFAFIAAASAQLGGMVEATKQAQEVLKRDPTFSVDAYLATLHYRNNGDRMHHREGLLKAGLPA